MKCVKKCEKKCEKKREKRKPKCGCRKPTKMQKAKLLPGLIAWMTRSTG